MAKTPYRDTFTAALIERSKSPLKSGEYKLKEACANLRKRYAALDVIEDALESKKDIPDNCNLFGWLGHEWRDQLPKLPHEIAGSVGYEVLPAIRVMCAEPNASPDLKSYQNTAERALVGAISYLDAQMKVLSTPAMQRAATLKQVGILRWSMQQILMTIDDTAAIAKIALPGI
jgi:hypothetical protein